MLSKIKVHQNSLSKFETKQEPLYEDALSPYQKLDPPESLFMVKGCWRVHLKWYLMSEQLSTLTQRYVHPSLPVLLTEKMTHLELSYLRSSPKNLHICSTPWSTDRVKLCCLQKSKMNNTNNNRRHTWSFCICILYSPIRHTHANLASSDMLSKYLSLIHIWRCRRAI